MPRAKEIQKSFLLGQALIYTSATLSLAALEFLVHLSGPGDAPELVFFRIEFEARLVRSTTPEALAKAQASRDPRVGPTLGGRGVIPRFASAEFCGFLREQLCCESNLTRTRLVSEEDWQRQGVPGGRY